MTPTPQKTAIASAISLIIGTMAGIPASADTMTQIQVTDVGSTLNGVNDGGSGTFSTVLDQNSGGFRFGKINPTTYQSVIGWTGDVGPMLAQGNANPTGSFSTGFIFSSTPFVPFTFGNGLSGDINVDNAGNLSLDFADLDLGGNFQTGGPGIDFLLPPDDPVAVNWVTNGANNDEKRVSFQWNHLITTAEDPSNQFTGFNARWIIEGVAAVTDGPPLIFINGANGQPSPDSTDISQDIVVGTSYVDQGAVCQDVVDGDITANVTTTPADLTNIDTSALGSFTVEYDCPDSAANNAATRTRTVNITASDTTPPDITLLSPTESEPGRDDPNPMTVNILQGVTYVDAGATCEDNVDGDISGNIVTTGSVDTAVPGTYPIDFDCSDSAENAATTQIRTVNVIADNEAPVVSLIGANPFTLAVGSVWNDPGAICIDTNPVDPDPVDISDRLVINPLDIDTSNQGTTTVTYDCSDLAGNPAEPQTTRTVNVVAGQNFRIISMTVSDLDGDGTAGCFAFNNLDPVNCGANLFSSDDSGSPGAVGTGSERIRGDGTDTDAEGNPLGVDLDNNFQPVTEFITPPPPDVLTEAARLPVGRIAPGFLFAKFPFVPVTFDPSSTPGGSDEVASEPSGFVTVSGTTALLTMESLPFGGLYESNAPNLFFLDPDEGTFNGVITQVNDDDNGTTRTFNYQMTWNHLITDIEDPTGQFVNFDAFWRLEGVITANSIEEIINNAPIVTDTNASQDDRDPTSIVVVNDGGLVTVTVDAEDPDGDELTFDWSQNNVTAVGPTDRPIFIFESAGLPQGALGLLVTVSDDVAEPLSDVGEIVLRVERTAPVLSDSEDSDGDGISDADEGFGDDDGDSIPNYQDPIDGAADPGRNRVDFRDPSGGDIVTSAGRLRQDAARFLQPLRVDAGYPNLITY